MPEEILFADLFTNFTQKIKDNVVLGEFSKFGATADVAAERTRGHSTRAAGPAHSSSVRFDAHAEGCHLVVVEHCCPYSRSGPNYSWREIIRYSHQEWTPHVRHF